ncbi:hypothetical protein [Plantibacter sp. CFBP 8775]|uniref:hypothetical protein n=1 Tax=Plantibacter sp. CFBP 8775 TaxID=2774038 RepID=UPI001786CBE6|nr:hypothetical protein [Plantibacter sp. CFBP 8775]MBD8102944.1 hypothetical protein [Plantibacter sp. CFBP 8775]
MDTSLAPLVMLIVFFGSFFIWMLCMPWFIHRERHSQHRQAKAGVIGVVDEVFHPEAHEAHVVWEAQKEMPAPAPLVGDKLFPRGRITLDLHEHGDAAQVGSPRR